MGIHLTSYIEPPGRTGHLHNLNHCVYLSNNKPRTYTTTEASILSIITGHISDTDQDLDVDIHMDHTDDDDRSSSGNSSEEDELYTHRRLLRRPRNIPLRRSMVPSLLRKPSAAAAAHGDYKKFVTYGCRYCRNHLSSSLHIISKDYRGKTGDAYLISSVCNVLEDKVETRSMLTGEYLVCDIVCSLCKRVLGWKYLKSQRKEQRYKEGKYILEVETICRCD